MDIYIEGDDVEEVLVKVSLLHEDGDIIGVLDGLLTFGLVITGLAQRIEEILHNWSRAATAVKMTP